MKKLATSVFFLCMVLGQASACNLAGPNEAIFADLEIVFVTESSTIEDHTYDLINPCGQKVGTYTQRVENLY